MTQAELLSEQIVYSRDWTLRLLADLRGDDWSFQPAPGLAHPLWICGHLTVAQDLLIHTRCLGSPVLSDDFKSKFPIGGAIKPVDEFSYPAPKDLLDIMATTQRQTLETVRAMSDELLAEPAYAADGKSPHPHYRDKRGAVSHCSRHEAFHAGQLAMIRRLLGKPFLR